MRKTKFFNEKIICFDFDGTITLNDNYPLIGECNIEIKTLINKLYNKGYVIIINSARQTIHINDIINYLNTNEIKYNHVLLATKPIADLYIDDKGLFGNVRYLELFIDFYFSSNIINDISTDDLISIFQENICNIPEYPNIIKSEPNLIDNFRILLPFTGGMDSTTLWKMLEESGDKYIPIYINFGQDYAKKELDVIKQLTPQTIISNVDINFKKYKHILIGRNAIIILLIAEYMKTNNYWGEIWFGNLQGESPIIGGDKSRRFFNDMNSILINNGYDITIKSPLIGLDKFDLVNWWKDRDIDILINTVSCFDNEGIQCGKCQSCFRKYIAFLYHGIDISNQFPIMQFDEYIAKYQSVMQQALDENIFTKYSKERCIKTLNIINKINER